MYILFYRDEAENRIKDIRPFISEETTNALLEKIGKSTKKTLIVFQGGEPTLIGLDYYKNFVEKEKELTPVTVFTHAFQTNGYSMNEKWAEFFKDNNFLEW